MSRIFLLRPPAVFASSSYSVPLPMPQAPAYLAANLLKHGHEVQCLDALGEGVDHIGVSYASSVRYRGLSTEAIVDRIKSAPDAIGVSAQFSQDWPHIEGMPEPLDYVGELSKFSDEDKLKILRDNTRGLNERRPV